MGWAGWVRGIERRRLVGVVGKGWGLVVGWAAVGGPHSPYFPSAAMMPPPQ